MVNYVSLRVKCPLCGASLMDENKLIDTKPGVKLQISVEAGQGEIWLSSIYGSYNYEATVNVRDEEIAQFFCPHCKQQLLATKNCYACNAPLVPVHLLEGGKVSICSRAGCEKHSIEFEDLNVALHHFYEDFAYRGQQDPVAVEKAKHPTAPPPRRDDDDRDIIESGTFLHAFCPHCKKSLNERDMLKFKVMKGNNEIGYLMLSPYLNVFTRKSSIHLPEDTAVEDIRCWHCDSSLMVDEDPCPRCNSDVARITVAAMSRMVDFYICSKKGCTWHGLSDDDLKYIIMEDSEEW
ncbi:MAG: hypothetical protein K8R90_03605 [Candidatus Cloacimonetes bacterium]|nr:hypothetical protein [Candidatus Cloacimonadota bacterium]